MTFPSTILTGIAENRKELTAYEFRILADKEDYATVEIAFTDPEKRYTDTELESDALREFVNRNGCDAAESVEDHDVRFFAAYHVTGDHENIRRASIYIKKNAYKEKE